MKLNNVKVDKFDASKEMIIKYGIITEIKPNGKVKGYKAETYGTFTPIFKNDTLFLDNLGKTHVM